MVRIDINDFFMSGKIEDLVNFGCSVITCTETRALAEKVASFLLRHQLVRSDLLPGRCWRVRLGSGMGLRHSAALCDAVLYVLSERGFALNRVARTAMGIVEYVRFRDDIFIVGNNRVQFRRWYDYFVRRNHKVFSMKVVEWSQQSVEMLAIQIFRSDDGLILTRPRAATMDGPILPSFSGHPVFVHRSWPRALLRSQLMLTSPTLWNQVVDELVARFKRHHASAVVIQGLLDAFDNFVSHPLRIPGPRTAIFEKQHAWLVLPFHPSMQFVNLNAAVRRVFNDPYVGGMWHACFRGNAPVVKISWKNRLRNSAATVQYLSRWVVGRGCGGACVRTVSHV